MLAGRMSCRIHMLQYVTFAQARKYNRIKNVSFLNPYNFSNTANKETKLYSMFNDEFLSMPIGQIYAPCMYFSMKALYRVAQVLLPSLEGVMVQ